MCCSDVRRRVAGFVGVIGVLMVSGGAVEMDVGKGALLALIAQVFMRRGARDVQEPKVWRQSNTITSLNQ